MTTEQESITHAHIAAGRAIDELRRQSGLLIRAANGQVMANFPVEFADETLFSGLQSPALLITSARAQALGLSAQALRINAQGLALADVMAIADPLAASAPPTGLDYVPASEIDLMALKLAKYASLLPALLIGKPQEGQAAWLSIEAADIERYIAHPLLDVVPTAQAALPVEDAENARIISFRSRHAASVHLALIVGDAQAQPAPLVRIHSSCVTGDILGSLRCDCGDQLRLALEQIRQAGSGVLIYLHQEGRGIGITNKLRAYRLQERGLDTYDANLMLGFEEDERDFVIAAAILKQLHIRSIRMLTNNPHKMAALEQAGIHVAERVPLVAPGGRHNHAYLDAKAKKSGHIF